MESNKNLKKAFKKAFQSTIKARKHHSCYQQILKQDNASNTEAVARVNPRIIIIAPKQCFKSKLLALQKNWFKILLCKRWWTETRTKNHFLKQETDLFQTGGNPSITNHLGFHSLKNLCLNTSHNHLVCKLVTHKKVRGLTILATACKGGKCLWYMYHNSSHIPTLIHAQTSTHAILTTSNSLETHLQRPGHL